MLGDMTSAATLLFFFLGWRSCIQRKSSGGIRNQTGTVVKRTRRGSSESRNNPCPGTAICLMIVSYSWKNSWIIDCHLFLVFGNGCDMLVQLIFFCLMQVSGFRCQVFLMQGSELLGSAVLVTLSLPPLSETKGGFLLSRNFYATCVNYMYLEAMY